MIAPMAQDDETSNPPQDRGPRVTIVTDMPVKFTVVKGEAALVHAFMGELIARIAMNDNEDEP